MESVTIGNSVESIGQAALSHCPNLTSIVVDVNNANYDSREDCNALIRKSDNTLLSGCRNTVIHNSVESIGDYAFSGCTDMPSVSIPNSVVSIGERAFGTCLGLTSVTIGNRVKSIGDYAFHDCYNLSSVTIGNSVESIGDCAFLYCESLRDVYCHAEQVPSAENYTFLDSNIESATLHVPSASVEIYSDTEPWSGFGTTVGLSEFELNISFVGYATLFLDYNVDIPAGVEVYVARETVGNSIKMDRVEGVLPANTGVIVVAEEGTYNFIESGYTPATIGTNLLKGTVEDTYIQTESGYSYYVLSCVDDAVGMYRAKITDGQFLNNANKAYVSIEDVDLSRKLVFDFGCETAIESIPGADELKSENENVKTVVFDLGGRRVQNAQKGVFIQNGKLVIK